MLSAILSNMGTGCLSMSGQAPLPLPQLTGDLQPSFKSRQNCHENHCFFPPFCVCLRNKFCSLETFCAW